MDDAQIIRSGRGPDDERAEWRAWLASPPGRYALAWEQQQFDTAVADVFGFHALQCGLPEIDALRANRMPHRIRACVPCEAQPDGACQLCVEHLEELPVASGTLDLVVLPHVLEFALDPHQVLREVERVLRPEGRLILSGFNPVSLWGARHALGRTSRRRFLPAQARPIALPRLRDWLKLLSFEIDGGRYGCYRPPCRTQRGLDRSGFMEAAGDRWWPICGAVYFVEAVKRVAGMRLIGPAWRQARAKRAGAVVAAPRTQDAPYM